MKYFGRAFRPADDCFAMMFAMLCSLSLFANASADSSIPSLPLTRASLVFSSKTPDGWGWTTAPWNGNDAQYRRIRTAIDSSLASGDSYSDVYMSYRAKAMANPNDSTAQFGRAYSAWQAAKQINKYDQNWGVLEDALRGLDSIKYAQTYNTARIRYLIQSRLSNGPKLLGIAQRIYLADPTDYDNKCRYASTLSYCCNAENEKNLVAPLLQQLESSFPSAPDPYLIEGYMYTDLMTKSNHFNKANTDSAITAFKRYQQMVPAGYYLSTMAQSLIDGLERVKANNYQLPPN